MLDLLVWAAVVIFYLFNLFFKKLAKDVKEIKDIVGTHETDPLSDNDPYEEIRREILRKREKRRGLREAEVELAMEEDKARETEAKKITTEVDGPSQFQMHMEEHSQRIKEKQEEAEQLKIHLEQMKSGHLKEEGIGGLSSNNRAVFSRWKVRDLLTKKSDIKAALIAGEILTKPLALRTEIKS